MAQFYTWPEFVRLITTLLISICILAQTLTLIASAYRRLENRFYLLEVLLEFSILIEILVFSLLHGKTMLGYELNLLLPTGYEALRITVVVVIIGLVSAVCVKKRNWWNLSIICASLATLPVTEILFAELFPYFFMAALVFFLVRGMCLCILKFGELKSRISILSVKNSMDFLPIGVMILEPDGHIALSNHKMQYLMQSIFGRVYRNGKQFHADLKGRVGHDRHQNIELDDQIICALSDDSTWMFHKSDMMLKNKAYIQISAIDITEQWKLNLELENQNNELMQQSEEIKGAIDNLSHMCRVAEIQKAKNRAHEILGERLSILLRNIQNERNLDHELLSSLAKGLMDDLKVKEKNKTFYGEIATLQRTFSSVDVKVNFEGNVPEGFSKPHLFTDIIKEGIINAVRHAFATEVFIKLWTENNTYKMMITDNGIPPSKKIVEGGGISGIREELGTYGGKLEIETDPKFILLITLPRRD